MSLILDALRKLDREKEHPERGLVVVAAPETQATRASRLPALALALVLGSAFGVGFALLWLRSSARPPDRRGVVAGGAPASAAPGGETALPPAPSAAPAVPAGSPSAPAVALASAPPRRSPAATATSPSAAPRPPLASPLTPPPPPPAAPSAAAAAEPADPGPAAEATPEAAAPRPEPEATAPTPGPRLEAISQREGRPVAILSGRLVFEGDSFDGIRVLRIGAAEVEIERDGRRQVLRF